MTIVSGKKFGGALKLRSTKQSFLKKKHLRWAIHKFEKRITTLTIAVSDSKLNYSNFNYCKECGWFGYSLYFIYQIRLPYKFVEECNIINLVHFELIFVKTKVLNFSVKKCRWKSHWKSTRTRTNVLRFRFTNKSIKLFFRGPLLLAECRYLPTKIKWFFCYN